MSPYLTKKDSFNTIGIIGSKATDLFYNEIWLKRCRLFADQELAKGIIPSDKSHVSLHHHDHTPVSHSYIRHIITSPTRWSTWISNMLTNGSSWTNFHTYINNLII